MSGEKGRFHAHTSNMLQWTGLENTNDPEVNNIISQSTTSGLASISKNRIGIGGLSNSNSNSLGRWIRSSALVQANLAAGKMREAARLKALQRTPYTMVLARIKLLLDRLAMFKVPFDPSKSFRQSSVTRQKSKDMRPSMKSSMASGPATSHSVSKLLEAAVEKASNPESAKEPAGRQGYDPVARAMAQLQQPGFHPSMLTNDAERSAAIEKTVEELNTSFFFVSDFLRKVPEEVRLKSILHARLENYKKDQDMYTIGDPSDKFYMLLSGHVDVWTHPPGHPRLRTVIASFKKGQFFGEVAILNNEKHSSCATSTGNCAMLVLDRHAFLEVFGAYFQAKMLDWENFFISNVEMFRSVPMEESREVIRRMLLTTYPAGTEWEPSTEPQIYFVKKGGCAMESHDKRFVPRDLPRLVEGDYAPVEDEGVLANVMLKDGRLMGTLGHEEELRKIRRAMIPKKTIATLEPGGRFGGGSKVMGEGDLQSSLKLLATTEVELFHIHVDIFLKYASPRLTEALRNDESFRLTYYCGRVGSIGSDEVVGHRDSQLAAAEHSINKQNQELDFPAQQIQLVGWMTKPPAPQAPAKASSKKKGPKLGHEIGKYSPEVVRALHYIDEIKTQFEDHALLEEKAVLFRNGTPSERFWASPALCASKESNMIRPLVAQAYPEGLGPLADKVENLIERSIRHTRTQIANEKPGSDNSQLVERIGRLSVLGTPIGFSSARPMSSQSERPGTAHNGLEGDGFGGFTSSSSAQYKVLKGASPSATAPELRSVSALDYTSLTSHVNRLKAAHESCSPSPPTLALPTTTPSAPYADHAGGSQGAGLPPSPSHVAQPQTKGSQPGASPPTPFPRLGSATQTLPMDVSRQHEDFDVDEELSLMPHAERDASSAFHLSPDPSSHWAHIPTAVDPVKDALSGYTPPSPGATRKHRPGSVAAACLMWERSQDVQAAPMLRQCLTYEEISRLKRPSSSLGSSGVGRQL